MTSQQGVGVILYGPPAAGKDTVTSALSLLDRRFQLYQRLKVGTGRMTGYRMGTDSELNRLQTAGQVIYANNRYGAIYAIDAPELDRMISSGSTPIIHLGQSEAINVIIESTPHIRWTTVELWCPREVAAERIRARNTGDEPDRLDAYDATPHLVHADVRIDTASIAPEVAAQIIHEVFRNALDRSSARPTHD